MKSCWKIVTTISLTAILVFRSQLTWSWSNDVQASGEFTATVALDQQDLYQVHMSPVSNLHWISTSDCSLELLFDDVRVEIYEKNGQRFGAVLKLISDKAEEQEWAKCSVTGLYSEAPNR